MKRLTAIILVLLMLLSVLSCMFSSAYAAMPSADVLNGYENICLTYTYNKEWGNLGRHNVNDFMPYVSYLDTEGNIKDYFFDKSAIKCFEKFVD